MRAGLDPERGFARSRLRRLETVSLCNGAIICRSRASSSSNGLQILLGKPLLGELRRDGVQAFEPEREFVLALCTDLPKRL